MGIRSRGEWYRHSINSRELMGIFIRPCCQNYCNAEAEVMVTEVRGESEWVAEGGLLLNTPLNTPKCSVRVFRVFMNTPPEYSEYSDYSTEYSA